MVQQQQGQQQQVVPFRRASVRKHSNLTTITFVASARDLLELISKGFIAKLLLYMTGDTTQGAVAPTLHEDAPFSLIRRITLVDSVGGTIFTISGYGLYVYNRLMAAMAGKDHAASGDLLVYSNPIATSTDNVMRWCLELPVETNQRDNLGLLPNQSAAFKYTLTIEWGAVADVWTANVPSAFDLTLVPEYEYYTVPSPARPNGQQQQVAPPQLGVIHTVIEQQFSVTASGPNRLALPVGNIYRSLIMIVREGGTRVGSLAGVNACRLKYGDDVIKSEYPNQQDLRTLQFRRNGDVGPDGCLLIDFTSDSGLEPGLDYRRDLVDTRELAQFWLEMDWAAAPAANTTVSIIRDELIVPQGVAL